MLVVLLFVCLTVPALGEHDYGNEVIPQTLRRNGPLEPDTTLHLAGINDVILPGHGPVLQLSVEGPLAHKIKHTKLSHLQLPYEMKKQILSGIYQKLNFQENLDSEPHCCDQLLGHQKYMPVCCLSTRDDKTGRIDGARVRYSFRECYHNPDFKDYDKCMEVNGVEPESLTYDPRIEVIDPWDVDDVNEATTPEPRKVLSSPPPPSPSVPAGGVHSVGKMINNGQSGVMINNWNNQKLHGTVNDKKQSWIQSVGQTLYNIMPLKGFLIS